MYPTLKHMTITQPTFRQRCRIQPNWIPALLALGTFVYVLLWLAEERVIGFVDLIEYSLYALLAGALWRTFHRRRLNSSRYYVEVCKPDNNSIHLIERR